MNREIKFRVWDSENKSMLDFGKQIFFTDAGELVFRSFHNHYIDSYPKHEGTSLQKRCKIMQFTGSIDKNGKDIYEHDIVRVTYINYPNDPEKRIRLTPFVAHVAYHDYSGCFFMWQCEIDPRRSMFGSRSMEVEIIGNNYENPEIKQDLEDQDWQRIQKMHEEDANSQSS